MSDNNPVPPPPGPGATPPPAPPAAAGYGVPQPGYPAQQPPYGAPPQYGAAPPYGSAQPHGSTQPYGAAGQYGAPYGYGAPAKTNTLAIVSLVASLAGLIIVPFIGSIVGVITGHMSLSQLKSNGEEGRGLALAGTIVGWVGIGLSIIGIFALIAFFGFLASVSPSYSY